MGRKEVVQEYRTLREVSKNKSTESNCNLTFGKDDGFIWECTLKHLTQNNDSRQNVRDAGRWKEI